MSEYIIELPDSGAADEFVAKMGIEDCRIYGYRLTGEVVRCRDCAKADWVAAVGHGGFTCRVHGWTSDSVGGFCAWGERRGDAE